MQLALAEELCRGMVDPAPGVVFAEDRGLMDHLVPLVRTDAQIDPGAVLLEDRPGGLGGREACPGLRWQSSAGRNDGAG